MEFSHEQQLAFDLYLQGKNVFLTGPGGTGKSKWIQRVYQHALENELNIHVCAMTGCAAILLNCNACTLHSWAGIGLGTDDRPIKEHAKKRWISANILIVDEVSMMALDLFEKLNQLGKHIRQSHLPFGGIQLLFCGDFYQLPPVNADYCFESSIWKSTFHTIHLITNFRQNDETFQTILSEIRKGKISKSSYKTLMGRVGIEYPPDITQLVSTRDKAEHINTFHYSTLEGEEYIYIKERKVDLPMSESEKHARKKFTDQQLEYELSYLYNHTRCDPTISLKIGTIVMCIVNMHTSPICNGSQGIVVGFKNKYPIVRFLHGDVTITPHVWKSEKIPGIGIEQIPLIYAWAITIHKSQGATMDRALIDAGHTIFACGQMYVALSRVKSLEGLFLQDFRAEKIKINKKVVDFYEN
jgi:ATP-dependent DNA helicase PIF1